MSGYRLYTPTDDDRRYNFEQLMDEIAGWDDGRMDCGCPIAAHPTHPNMLAGAAEREGRVCRLGWPKHDAA